MKINEREEHKVGLFKKIDQGERIRKTLYQGKIKAVMEAIGWNLRQLLDYLESHNLDNIRASLMSLRDVRQLIYNAVIHINRLKKMNISTDVNIELKLIGYWVRELQNLIDCGSPTLVIDVTTGNVFVGYHYRTLVKIVNPILNS